MSVKAERRVRFQQDDAVEVFTNVGDSSHLTPSVEQIQSVQAIGYKAPAARSAAVLAPASTLSKPNYEDILRRVSVVVFHHIQNCEERLRKADPKSYETGLYHLSQLHAFNEENFISQQYIYNFIRSPISRMGFCYGIKKFRKQYSTPTLNEVHTFLETLFVKAQLSPECSIVCLIYVERLMEHANVPLVAQTWAPVVLCGMLLASKVWADLSSWNIEFSQIFPRYSVQSVNKLERMFCHNIAWDLYISSSSYAKYYFALRAATEKKDFRRNYNIMVIQAPGADMIAQRSGGVKNSVLGETLSMSL